MMGLHPHKPIINQKSHILKKHHSLVYLKVLRTPTSAYNYLPWSLFYNRMLTVPCNLLNTALKVQNRMGDILLVLYCLGRMPDWDWLGLSVFSYFFLEDFFYLLYLYLLFIWIDIFNVCQRSKFLSALQISSWFNKI